MLAYFGRHDEIGPLGWTSQSCRALLRTGLDKQQTNFPIANARFCTTLLCRTLQHAAAGCSSLRYPAHTSLTKHSSGAVYPQACRKARKGGVSHGLEEDGLPLDGPPAGLWWEEMAVGQLVLRRLFLPSRHLNTARPLQGCRDQICPTRISPRRQPSGFTVLLFATRLYTIGVAIHGRSFIS